jgi:hypothetical protein
MIPTEISSNISKRMTGSVRGAVPLSNWRAFSAGASVSPILTTWQRSGCPRCILIVARNFVFQIDHIARVPPSMKALSPLIRLDQSSKKCAEPPTPGHDSRTSQREPISVMPSHCRSAGTVIRTRLPTFCAFNRPRSISSRRNPFETPTAWAASATPSANRSFGASFITVARSADIRVLLDDTA